MSEATMDVLTPVSVEVGSEIRRKPNVYGSLAELVTKEPQGKSQRIYKVKCLQGTYFTVTSNREAAENAVVSHVSRTLVGQCEITTLVQADFVEAMKPKPQLFEPS